MYCQRWRHLIIRRAVLRKYYKENDKAGVSGSRYIAPQARAPVTRFRPNILSNTSEDRIPS